MPSETFYCSQQINIPPEFPDILKQFTKAAIRTQPKDVLGWSAAYFKALADNEIPPVKDRLEKPTATQKTDTGLTPEILRILNRQLGPKNLVDVNLIQEKWTDNSLPIEKLNDIVVLGGFSNQIDWFHFIALACSTLRDGISPALQLICEILTLDPLGAAANIPYETFETIYKFLAKIDGDISADTISNVLTYLSTVKDKQDGKVRPSNFTGPDCPSLS